MQQFCIYGSVRGASGNRRPYRDKVVAGNHFRSAKYFNSRESGWRKWSPVPLFGSLLALDPECYNR
jgi:hypothetical protein